MTEGVSGEGNDVTAAAVATAPSVHAGERKWGSFNLLYFQCFQKGRGLRGVDVTPPVSNFLPETRSESHWRGGGGKGSGGPSNISSVSADESRRSWECVCTRV